MFKEKLVFSNILNGMIAYVHKSGIENKFAVTFN